MTEFLPYGRHTITEADIAAVVDVLQGPYLTQGPAVPAFERAVAQQVGARHGVAMNSATSALHIACLALGLGPGDRLWTTPITFVASANCGRYCNAEIDFVDIDPKTALMSVEALEEKLKKAAKTNSLPKVLVPVHLCGTSCDMESVGRLAKEYGVAVLEDASHAIGGERKGTPVGNCQYSDISVFSFHPVKIVTTAEGGLATTNDQQIAQKMTRLRSHGITREEREFEMKAPGPWHYEQQELGFNYRLTDIQAALGLSQLKRLDHIIAERHRLFRIYEEELGSLPATLLKVPKDVKSALHLAVIRLRNTDPEHHRRVFKGLRESGIGVQLHYTPVHLQPYYRQLGFAQGDFPEAEAYAKNAISLPLYPGLKADEQRRVISKLSELIC